MVFKAADQQYLCLVLQWCPCRGILSNPLALLGPHSLLKVLEPLQQGACEALIPSTAFLAGASRICSPFDCAHQGVLQVQ